MTRELTPKDFEDWANENPEVWVVKIEEAFLSRNIDWLSVDLRYFREFYTLIDGSKLYETVLKWKQSKETIYKPFETLTEEQQLKFLFSAFRCVDDDSKSVVYLSPIAVTPAKIRFDSDTLLDLKQLFKDCEVYSPREKAWNTFGIKVE